MDIQTKKESKNCEEQIAGFDFKILEKSFPTYDVERLKSHIKIIARSLTKNDLFYSINLVYAFLYNTNQLKYFDVACHLIKLFFLTGKENFNMILNFLINPKWFITSSYIEHFISSFHRAVYLAKVDLAKCYYILIKSINKISKDNKEYLKVHLDTMNNLKNSIDEEFSYSKLDEVMNMAVNNAKENRPTSVIKVTYDKLYAMIKYKLGKLKDFGGSTLICDIDEFNINSILTYLAKFDNIVFKVVYCPKKSILIKTYEKQTVNIENLYLEYNIAKKEGHFERCCELLNKIMNHTENPSSQLYANLAYIYMKLNSLDVALKYYKLADTLNISETGEEKYLKVISLLEYACDEPIKSFNVNIDFTEIMVKNNLDYLTVEKIKFLLKERKNNLEEIFYHFNLTLKQQLIVKMIIIKDYFLEGNRQVAQRLLMDVKEDVKNFQELEKTFLTLYDYRELIRIEGLNNRRNILRNNK